MTGSKGIQRQAGIVTQPARQFINVQLPSRTNSLLEAWQTTSILLCFLLGIWHFKAPYKTTLHGCLTQGLCQFKVWVTQTGRALPWVTKPLRYVTLKERGKMVMVMIMVRIQSPQRNSVGRLKSRRLAIRHSLSLLVMQWSNSPVNFTVLERS